jgi:hypothetical protein
MRGCVTGGVMSVVVALASLYGLRNERIAGFHHDSSPGGVDAPANRAPSPRAHPVSAPQAWLNKHTNSSAASIRSSHVLSFEEDTGLSCTATSFSCTLFRAFDLLLITRT